MSFYGGLTRAIQYNDSEERALRNEADRNRAMQEEQQRYQNRLANDQERQAVSDQRYQDEVNLRERKMRETEDYNKNQLMIKKQDDENRNLAEMQKQYNKEMTFLEKERTSYEDSSKVNMKNLPDSDWKILQGHYLDRIKLIDQKIAMLKERNPLNKVKDDKLRQAIKLNRNMQPQNNMNNNQKEFDDILPGDIRHGMVYLGGGIKNRNNWRMPTQEEIATYQKRIR